MLNTAMRLPFIDGQGGIFLSVLGIAPEMGY